MHIAVAFMSGLWPYFFFFSYIITTDTFLFLIFFQIISTRKT